MNGLLAAAQAFVRRHSKSKAVRNAEKRREERRRREAAKRAKQTSAVAGVSAAGTFGYAVTVAPLASAAIAGGAAGIAAIALVHFWRSRKQTPVFSRHELSALPREAEEWLLDQRPLLPPHADPALDLVLTHLADLPPHLARLDVHSPLAWEARRLIGEHLPGLVASWCALPAITRENDFCARHRFVHGLGTIAEELARLAAEASAGERLSLETRSRFLEARYRDGRLSIP